MQSVFESEAELQAYSPEHNRVLMVTGAIARGGAERQMIALTDGLLTDGFKVEVFELQGVAAGQPSFVDEFTRRGVTVRRASGKIVQSTKRGVDVIDSSGLRRFATLMPPGIATTCGALARTIGNFRPRVVHCWSDLSNVVCGFVSSSMGVPRVVLAQRTLPPPFWFDATQSDLYREAYRALAATPAVVMLNNSAVSAREFERWLGFADGSIKLVYNGFLPSSMHIRDRSQAAACRARLGLPHDARVAGAILRFAPEKDPDLWLETAAAIAAAQPDVHFILAGYGHDDIADRLRAKGRQLGLAERLVLPGVAIDVGQIYGALDVLLLTSRSENVPNVMIEAQAAGVPVIGPDVGGIREAMIDGVTGLLARERSAQGLAAATLQALNSPDWRSQAAARGPAFVAQRFGQDRMLRETVAIYR